MNQNQDEAIVKRIGQELFGLEPHARQIIQKIRVYLEYPSLFKSPLVLNLVGPTGVGKTRLAKMILEELDLKDRSFYINLANQSDKRWSKTIEKITKSIGHGENQDDDEDSSDDDDGELDPDLTVQDLIDEMQAEEDAKTDQSQDFFEATSDTISDNAKRILRKKKRSKKKVEKKDSVVIFLDDAHSSRQLTKHGDEMLRNDTNELLQLLDEGIAYHTGGEFIPTILFTSMNLGLTDSEAVEGWAGKLRTEDETLGLNFPTEIIMQRLSELWRPEGVARFRSNWFYFPELSKESGSKIMDREFNRISTQLQEVLNVNEVSFDPSVKSVLFRNFDLRGMGGRGLESLIDGKVKADIGRWILEVTNKGRSPKELTHVSVEGEQDSLLVTLTFEDGTTHELEPLSIAQPQSRKKKIDPNDRAVQAIHEAGHALAHYILRGVAPEEIKIGLDNGEFKGFMKRSRVKRDNLTRTEVYHSMIISLAGLESEKLIWGEMYQTAGSKSDLQHASAYAQNMVLHLGFGDTPSYRVVSADMWSPRNSLIMNNEDRAEIDKLLLKAQSDTRALLTDNKRHLVSLGKELYHQLELDAEQIVRVLSKVPTQDRSLEYANVFCEEK